MFLELFSEEIPARMQARGAETLARMVGEALASLRPGPAKQYYGARRIALALDLESEVAASHSIERGPRVGAPEQALAGFLRKHGAGRADLREEGGFHVLEKHQPAVSAERLIASSTPDLLRRFAWPKSMRWGGTSNFTWVRPLRRILCLFDGRVVEFSLAGAEDDGHGLVSGGVTEGHRFMAPGPFSARGTDDWERSLEQHFVIASAEERRGRIADGIASAAAGVGVTVVDDAALLDEVCGLVEWPVPLIGRIDEAFMDLPAEVMQVSMRVNQRYFATRTADGRAAPWFAFVANIVATDGGAAIIAGNERVLRARFSDARHFWDLDRRTPLADRVAALDGVTFHAELGSQGARVRRLVPLAGTIARLIGADTSLAERAALLCKADLTTGMVGELPELQGVMGGYYARHDGEADAVADAVRDHYAPRGASDPAPQAPLSAAVALADKFDQLTSFFGIGEKPTGSGDPFALRRAALGVIRIIRENGLRIPLRRVLQSASQPSVAGEVLAFIMERLRVQVRAEGARHDVLAAALASGEEDDILRVFARTVEVAALLETDDGRDLLAAYRRAANILRIENRKDGPHAGDVSVDLLVTQAERDLHAALSGVDAVASSVEAGDFAGAAGLLASLRKPLDAFFEATTVNDPDPALRGNRLRLLAAVRRSIDLVADFSQVEG
jgi:glycyl-tRNA synthetase beta chain